MENNIKSMRDVFLEKLISEMSRNKKIYFITADFGSPVLDRLQDEFPDRFINVGIAEQNLINVSAGLGLEGFTVFAYAIAPFISMRCYEQIRVNLAILSQLREINVNLIGVGAGYSYTVSGPTHQCLEDLSIMRTLPNVELLSPCDWTTVESFVQYCLTNNNIKYLRFDAKPQKQVYGSIVDLSSGFSELKKGKNICLVSTGFMTHKVLELKDSEVGIIDVYNLSKINEKEFVSAIRNYPCVISVEEGFVDRGGFDSFIANIIRRNSLDIKFKNIGVSNNYNFKLGSREYLHETSGCGIKDILDCISEESV